MKRNINLKSNQIIDKIIVGIIVFSVILTINNVGFSSQNTSSAGQIIMADDLKHIMTFLNSRVNNGFILSTYDSIQNAKLDKIIYNSTQEVTDLVEEMDYLKSTAKDNEEIKEINNKISENKVSLKKISIEEIGSLYLEKTGINLSETDIKARLANTSFIYIESRRCFYTEPFKTQNYLTVKTIEGMKTVDGKILVQITNSTAGSGDRTLMFKEGETEIVSTIVTLKPQDATYFIESNTEANDASLLYDHGIYTGYDNLDVNDLDYDFSVDYLSQFENGGEEDNTSKNTVVVVPKSNVPTALIISAITVGIIVILGALIIFVNKKFKPKKFDLNSFRYEERERSDDSLINKYSQEDFDEMEAEIEESEIHNNPADEEEAEREIEALAEARLQGKPLHTAFDELHRPKKRGRKASSQNKTEDK